jgi:hypothetical protein
MTTCAACPVVALGTTLRGTRAWPTAATTPLRSAAAPSVCGSLGGVYELQSVELQSVPIDLRWLLVLLFAVRGRGKFPELLLLPEEELQRFRRQALSEVYVKESVQIVARGGAYSVRTVFTLIGYCHSAPLWWEHGQRGMRLSRRCA